GRASRGLPWNCSPSCSATPACAGAGSAGLRLPLLRPHCHLRLAQRAVAARAGVALLASEPAPAKAGVVGVAVVDKEVFSRRTADYQAWVEAFARNHRLPIEWAEKGVRKEHHVLPWQRRMARDDAYGVLLHLQAHGAGAELSRQPPQIPHQEPAPAKAGEPNDRILARQRSRFTHSYCYLRDETLGPMMMRVASVFPFQTTDYLNGHSFIEHELKRAQIGFRKTDNAFLAVDDVVALQAAADR